CRRSAAAARGHGYGRGPPSPAIIRQKRNPALPRLVLSPRDEKQLAAAPAGDPKLDRPPNALPDRSRSSPARRGGRPPRASACAARSAAAAGDGGEAGSQGPARTPA